MATVPLDAGLARRLCKLHAQTVESFGARFGRLDLHWGRGPSSVTLRYSIQGMGVERRYGRDGTMLETDGGDEHEEFSGAYLAYPELYEYFWGVQATRSFFERLGFGGGGSVTVETGDGDAETYDDAQVFFVGAPLYVLSRGKLQKLQQAAEILKTLRE